MIRASEGTGGRPVRVRPTPRGTLTSVLQFLESRPAPHGHRPPRTPSLQLQPPRRLLSSLPSHGPLGMLGKRSYQHHSRAEAERRGAATTQDNPGHIVGSVLHNGKSSSGSNLRASSMMLRKRRPNWIDAPDDSFFLVSRETSAAAVRHLLMESSEAAHSLSTQKSL
ncbi:metastasis-associated protein MTA1-like [Clupea harengus]|uniref:Metastasis-associated protein MTA1-like n=1 Tax=Clupea harengus TaxID=7950 RepID=A0A6P8GLP5_CLUHA|nr:metastasis-associated protein MTA1-like [Clupea harengus]